MERMNLARLLPYHYSLIALACYAAILALAIWRAPWRYLAVERNLHVFLGTCVALMLLWTIRAELPGLAYHYFGATLLTLMFGWALAIVGISVVLLANALNGAGEWLSLPLNALALGAVPVMVSHGIWRLAEKRLPHNYFVYVFVCAYLGAGLAFLVSAIASSSLLILAADVSFERLAAQFFPLVLLMAFPEAFITGFVISVLAAYRPAWVRTFDDELYLKGK